MAVGTPAWLPQLILLSLALAVGDTADFTEWPWVNLNIFLQTPFYSFSKRIGGEHWSFSSNRGEKIISEPMS